MPDSLTSPNGQKATYDDTPGAVWPQIGGNMKLKNLGNTHHRVSQIGVGLTALGRPGYINIGHADDLEKKYDDEAMEARAHAVLDAAFDVACVILMPQDHMAGRRNFLATG
jgi:hypothetical protein